MPEQPVDASPSKVYDYSMLCHANPSGQASIDDVPGLRPTLAATCVAQFFLPFLLAAVTPILPAIGHSLHAGAFEISLINAVYSMSLAIFPLPAGRLGDIFGHKRMLMLGFAIIVAMTLMLPLASDIRIFVACRFVQGIGTSLTNTASIALLTALTPSRMRGQVLGTAVMGTFTGISTGPAISGALAEHLGWQYLFYGLVPLGLAIIGVVWKWVPAPTRKARRQTFHWASTGIWILGIAALSGGAIWCAAGLPALATAGVGICLTAIFTAMQLYADRRGITPILDVRMMIHNTLFSTSSLIALLNFCTVVGQSFFYCLFLQFHFGLSMQTAGLCLGIQPLMQFLLARPAGRFADRYGSVAITAIGLALCTAALITACTFGTGTRLATVIGTLACTGIGLALFASPNNSTIMGSVDADHLGQASGMLSTARDMGILISMVAASIAMSLYLGDTPASKESLPAFIASMHQCVLFYTAMNAAALLLCLWLLFIRHADRKQEP